MNSHNLGKLFVFEGPDNVGKTTISKSIVNLIRKEYKCEYISFPGVDEGTIGSVVYKIHHDRESYGIKNIDCNSMQALHIAAHIDLIKSKIIPLIEAGVSVVLDRFWWSSVVYGEAMGCDMRIVDKLIIAEKIAWNGILPDIIFNIERDLSMFPNHDLTEKLLYRYKKLATSERNNANIIDISNCVLSATVDNVYSEIEDVFNKKLHNQNVQVSLLADSYKKKDKRHPPSSLENLLAPTVVFDTYWKFAAERQDVFFARARGEVRPWTNDSIISEHKFTNAYRASDRVSQFLIKNVIYEGSQDAEEVFFRIILFKIFNKIETWLLLERELGRIAFSAFDYPRYDSILTRAIEANKRIYSAAYIMPTGGRGTVFDRKHRMHLHLVQQMMKDRLPDKIVAARSMGKVFELLKTYPGLGDFLAYQYATDINYSELTNFSETQFVVPGPGAKDGIRKCFSKSGGLSEAEIIKVVMEHQEEEFDRLGLEFKTLWGRPLMLIDCQNLFCETDKYARVRHPDIKGITGRSRIKQKFHPNPRPVDFWYPPKWGLNERIQNGEMP